MSRFGFGSSIFPRLPPAAVQREKSPEPLFLPVTPEVEEARVTKPVPEVETQVAGQHCRGLRRGQQGSPKITIRIPGRVACEKRKAVAEEQARLLEKRKKAKRHTLAPVGKTGDVGEGQSRCEKRGKGKRWILEPVGEIVGVAAKAQREKDARPLDIQVDELVDSVEGLQRSVMTLWQKMYDRDLQRLMKKVEKREQKAMKKNQ